MSDSTETTLEKYQSIPWRRKRKDYNGKGKLEMIGSLIDFLATMQKTYFVLINYDRKYYCYSKDEPITGRNVKQCFDFSHRFKYLYRVRDLPDDKILQKGSHVDVFLVTPLDRFV